MRKDEYILCAAIWFDDGVDRDLPEIKGKTGYVVLGRRHSNVFFTASVLSDDGSIRLPEKETQGFITNKNRFVDRLEAADIAFKAGQIVQPTKHPLGLFSEDLY